LIYKNILQIILSFVKQINQQVLIKLKRATTKEGKHDYASDAFVYVYIANLFEIDIEELIY